MLLNFSVLLLTVIAMELVSILAHRYVMHGLGWAWHRSHHVPHERNKQPWFELNDLYALVFAGIAIVLIALGTSGRHPLEWIGAGMTLYGALYFIAHDGLVHRRWIFRYLKYTPRRGYLKRLYQAHRLHHAVRSREGAVSFGFLYAPPVERLKQQLRSGVAEAAADGAAVHLHRSRSDAATGMSDVAQSAANESESPSPHL
jgi:beta-carotene 3-hydroxylase